MIYKKLAEARVKLQESKVKKSGKNKFSNFDYYELADFLPTINKINHELEILSIFTFNQTEAKLVVIDSEDSTQVEFSIPTTFASMKGANPIQELGATETYLRRYLFLVAYEITDGEVVDSLAPDKHETDPNRIKGIDMCLKSSKNKKTKEELEKMSLEEIRKYYQTLA